MTKKYAFSLFVLAILFSAFCVHDAESVFGILTPKEGKRGFRSDSINRQALTLQAIRAKLQRKEAYNAMISKMVCNSNYYFIYH
jgi:hypothetical protein